MFECGTQRRFVIITLVLFLGHSAFGDTMTPDLQKVPKGDGFKGAVGDAKLVEKDGKPAIEFNKRGARIVWLDGLEFDQGTIEFDAKGKLVRVSRVADIVQDGVVLDTRSALVRPGVIGLRLKATYSKLERPIKDFELRFKDLDEKVVLQVPEVDVLEVASDLELADGATAVFQMPRDDGRRLVVFLTARRIQID